MAEVDDRAEAEGEAPLGTAEVGAPQGVWPEIGKGISRCACGQPATANGRECPFHFRQRLLSVRIDSSVLVTRPLKNYWDTESLDEVFGEDRVDRYWDETKGAGALVKGPDGELYHTPMGSDEPRRATPELIDSYLGPESDDV